MNEELNEDMTKDVLVSITGLHYEPVEGVVDGAQHALEYVTPATYYERNGKRYIIYDEAVEGMQGSIKNKIKISDNSCMEVLKTGLTNSHMVFEKNKKNMTYYQTPMGSMVVAINTKKMDVNVTEDRIDVSVDYELDVNHSPLADCKIRMNIASAKDAREDILSHPNYTH